MADRVFSTQTNFNMALYDCKGVRGQWLKSMVEWDVEVDAANRRYRVWAQPYCVSSWNGPTSFTIRNQVFRCGNNFQYPGDKKLPNPISNTTFTMHGRVYSDWYAFDDNGKATVTSVPVGYKYCWKANQNAAGGICWNLREFCAGSDDMAHVNPAIKAEAGGPGPAYTPVGQVNISCQATGPYSGTATSSVDYGIGTSNSMTMSGAITGSSSSSTMTKTSSSLQPNSRNTVTVVASNGVSSTNASCSFVTPAANTLSNCRSIKSDEIMVDCTIQGGYGVYAPTTSFRYRLPGGDWNEFFQSKTKTQTTATIGSLKRDTTYEIQACTATTAGTYCGNIVRCKTTPGAYAIITSADPYIQEYPNNELPQNTRCNLCYEWGADCAPVKLQVFYRVKNGLDDKWWWTDVYETNQRTGTHCVTLIDLIPNQTVYEAIVRATGCDDVTWDSPVFEFTTPLLKRPYDYNCETLTYMADLICQALEAIKTGNKTIYANAASKDKCDPYSNNPTLSTLWSRFLRWGAGSACLMCDMVDYIIKSGKKNQYFVGEIGWVDILDHLEDEYADDDDDGKRLVMSGAVYDKIQEKLHEVWHYHGAVDYMVSDLNHIPADATTVLNAADNKVYKKQGSNWVIDDSIDQPDDFAVYHFNKENKPQGWDSTVKAGSAWYYWQGTWNNLDANIEWMEKVINAVYEHVDEFTFTEKCTDRIYVSTQDRLLFNCATDLVPNSERQVCFITEPLTTAPIGYHKIRFTTGADATIIQDQDVLDGVYAQEPNTPWKHCMDFVEWQDADNLGTAFDWTTRIYRDYNLTAIWNPHPVTITFDLDGGTGTTPSDINGHCGDAIGTLPTSAAFSKTGATFKGWAIDGVPIDSTYVLDDDATAVAIWEMQKFTVTVHPQNGSANTTTQVEYGHTIEVPAQPTYTDHIFVKWSTASDCSNTWDDTQPVTSNLDIYACWINANYTVTFDSNGGTAVLSQTVAYEDYATRPTDPTKTGSVLAGWTLNGQPYNFDVPVTEDITLVASWTNAWTVTFDTDGGTPVPSDQTVNDGDYAFQPSTDPTKDNCEFKGWYTGDEPEDCDE